MNKKILTLIFGIVFLLAMPVVSADIFDNVNYYPAGNGNLGYYEINDTLFWFLNNKQHKTITLLENGESVLSAWNIKEIELFKPSKLFDRTDYYKKDKTTDKSWAIKTEQQLYRQLVNKTEFNGVYDCIEYQTITNETGTYDVCINWEDNSYYETYEDWTDWQEYTWGNVQEGLYQTKTIVTRNNQYTGAAEWIDTNEGHELEEWATWWDSSWSKKRNITTMNTTISALYNITYDADMKVDFSDVRFVDYATESIELNFTLISKINSSTAQFRVNNLNVSQIMMYYGNSGASSTSSAENTFYGPSGVWLFDNGSPNDLTSNGYDGTVSGATVTNGRILKGYDFDGTSDTINMGDVLDFDARTEPFSVSFWAKRDTTGQMTPVSKSPDSNSGWRMQWRGTNIIFVRISNSGPNAIEVNTVSSYTDTTNPHMYTFTFDGSGSASGVKIYVDGSSVSTSTGVDTLNGDSSNAQDLLVGELGDGTGDFNGWIDEVMIWEKELNSTQVGQIYDQSIPSFIVGSEQELGGMGVDLIYPTSGLTTNQQYLNFTYNITVEGFNFTNTTLTVWNATDDTVFLTNFSALSGNTSEIINFTNILPDGDWKWNAELCTDDGSCIGGNNVSYTIDTTPFVEFISPTPSNSTNIFVKNFTAKVDLTEDHFSNITFYLYNEISLVDSQTYSDNTRQITWGNLQDGIYYYNATVWTTTFKSNSTETRTLLIHTSSPSILISGPTGTLDSIILGDNETLNYSIQEIGQNISHFDECWFEYSDTEEVEMQQTSLNRFNYSHGYANITEMIVDLGSSTKTFTDIPDSCIRRDSFNIEHKFWLNGTSWITCANGTNDVLIPSTLDQVAVTYPQEVNLTLMEKRPLNCSETETEFEYVYGQNTLCVHAIDIFGLHSQNDTSWDYKFQENSISFEDSTIEGSTENFLLNFTLIAPFQVSNIELVYDGVNYPSTFLAFPNYILGNNDLSIPGVPSETNRTFYFKITLSDGTVINSSRGNQTVSPIEIDDCSSYSVLILNYTQRDEASQELLTAGVVEVATNIYNVARENLIMNYSNQFNVTNPVQICLSINLSGSTDFSMDSTVKYTSNESSGYALEYHNIINFTLSNSTIPQNINLYSLLEEDTTEFQLTFRDSDLALAPNVLVHVDRQYVSDNDFKTVELPVTDSNGQAILHLVRNDIQYNFIMVDSAGNVLGTFNKKNVFCQDFTIGSCTLQLNALAEDKSVYDQAEDIPITYDLDYDNDTNTLSLEFLSKDLTSQDVKVVVTRDTDFGNRSVCTENLISTSGIISCNVTEIVDTDRYLFIEVYSNDKIVGLETQVLVRPDTGLGVNGAFLGFFLFLIIITIFSGDKKVLVVALVLGWVASIALGLLRGSLFGGVSAGIWLVVTAVIFLWKLNKEDGI